MGKHIQSLSQVSVVIVNWNGLRWLEKCLGSMTAQTYTKLEIIVVDNNSSDASVAYIKEAFPDIILVLNPQNRGFAGGVNSGIAVAQGELILLLNTDTWADRNLVSTLVSDLQNRNLDVVAPYEASYDGESRKPYRTLMDILGHPIYLAGRGESFYLSGVCLLFSKELYITSGGLDNNFFMYCEEADWFWRLNLIRKRFDYTADARVYHKSGGSTGQGIKYTTFLWRNQNTLQMLLKNYSKSSLLWVIPCYVVSNFAEMAFFFIILKPKISLTYLLGYWFNIRNLRTTLKERSIVQQSRLISDSEIRQRMFKGIAKVHHLLIFAGLTKEV